jgi:sec-independent protein translocase protein TatA
VPPGGDPGRHIGEAAEGKVSVVNLGPTELIIILLIVMLLFGAARLPKLARSLGESAKEFKNAQSAINEAGKPPEDK